MSTPGQRAARPVSAEARCRRRLTLKPEVGHDLAGTRAAPRRCYWLVCVVGLVREAARPGSVGGDAGGVDQTGEEVSGR